MSSKSQRKPKRTFWSRLRIYFRRFRITVLGVLLALVGVGVYLNHIGLPDFIKRPLIENLRSRGVSLEFSRLRLRGYRGIVAEDVRVLSTTNSPVLPKFTVRSVDVQLNYAALLHRKFEVRGVVLRQGSLVWELATNHEPARPFAITNLTVALRFLPGNGWSLDDFSADGAGVRWQANGQIDHATALRDWPVFQGRTKQPAGALLERLRHLQDALQQIHFTQPPLVRLNLNGDAERPESFSGSLTVANVSSTSPWGDYQNVTLRAHLVPARSNAPPRAEFQLTGDRAVTPWASLRKLDLHVDGTLSPAAATQLDCRLTLAAAALKGRAGSLDALQMRADWQQPLTGLRPLSGQVAAGFTGINSPWATVGAAAVAAQFSPSAAPLADEPALGFWRALLPFDLALNVGLTNAAVTNVTLQSLGFAATWQAPSLTLSNLQVRLNPGGCDARADLDVLTRRLQFAGAADFDVHLLSSILTAKSREWLASFTWQTPPQLALAGHLTLPAWTNRQPDWRGEVQPGIVLEGAVTLTNAACRGIRLSAATTHLNYSNRVWHLPDLVITRPEGRLNVNLRSEEVSHDFRIVVAGAFDPRALAPQLDEKGRRGLGYFQFTNAPVITADVSGNWYDPDRLGATATLRWEDFSYRDQHADLLTAALTYTNKILHVTRPHVERGTERVTADSLTLDFVSQRGYLTNGYTDTDPMAIATAIGPKTAQAVEHYQFLKPPVARVNGIIPLKGERAADLHFDVQGGPFRWLRFNLPHITGHIDWANESVTLTNLAASFYGGEGQGEAWFDVRDRGTTPFRFSLNVTNADLHALMADLHSPTNQLEGRLTGRLVITDATTQDFKSWNGYGRAKLRDGLIWDTPVFGMMSRVMNTFVPGIGNSRASDAGGKFTMTNSVIYTRDLDIRASGMRLQYDGTVDFQTRVDARVQAELLRDTWLIGPVMSTALWPVSKLFEYKVTGTLAKPEMEPVYMVPKLFLAPLHPMKAIKGMFVEPAGKTNAPPVWPEPPGVPESN